jgi:hypothetical protein
MSVQVASISTSLATATTTSGPGLKYFVPCDQLSHFVLPSGHEFPCGGPVIDRQNCPHCKFVWIEHSGGASCSGWLGDDERSYCSRCRKTEEEEEE